MAQKALKPYPTKPKATASLAQKERYMERCKAVDDHNREIMAQNRKDKELTDKIAKLPKTTPASLAGSTRRRRSTATTTKRRKATTRKKAATTRRKTTRRRY